MHVNYLSKLSTLHSDSSLVTGGMKCIGYVFLQYIIATLI